MKNQIQIELNPPTVFPVFSTDYEWMSVDVITIDEEGLINLAYYSFRENEWKFHTDTLVDYFEKGNEMKWGWYYSPFTKYDIELLNK